MSAPVPPYAVPPAPAPVALHPHREPTTYPLMLRTWAYAWWRPVLGLIGLLAGVLFVVPVLLLPVLAVGIALQGGPFGTGFAEALDQTRLTPASMLYLNLTLAGMTLVTWGLVRFLHRLRPRWLMSVRPGIRWRFFGACLGLSVVALVAQLVVGAFLPQDVDTLHGHLHAITGQTIAFAVVILLTTPLQAMGEEYAFRGYAMQAFGSLTRSPWFAILLSAVLFTAAHGSQNIPLLADRFAFGLLAGYLVLRTGGLEAGIALHIWNNIVAFGFGLAFGDIQQLLTETEASWWNLPLTVTQNGVYLVLVLLVAKRMGVDNRTRPPVLVDETAPV
ncbi:MAG: lysostaphin resistance A-like protein [Marmoricola sp.]